MLLLLLLLLLLQLSHFSRVWLCDPIDGSPPGSAVPGILQARTLEWVAISFSNAWKWKVKMKSLSRVRLFATPWTEAHQAPPSMGFSRQEYWSGVPLPSLGTMLYILLYTVLHGRFKYLGVLPCYSCIVFQGVGIQLLIQSFVFGLKFCYSKQCCTFISRSKE